MADATNETPKKKPRKPNVRGKGWRVAFLENLRITGIVRFSCRASGVGVKTAYEHRNNDEAFAEAWDDAIAEASEAFVLRARERALSATECSDTMLIFMLKSLLPETFGDRSRVELSADVRATVRMTNEELVAGIARTFAAVGEGDHRAGSTQEAAAAH
jgi:hypothetical protein